MNSFLIGMFSLPCILDISDYSGHVLKSGGAQLSLEKV